MIKKIILAVVLMSASLSTLAADFKVAVVDVQAVLYKAYKYKDMESAIKKQLKAQEEELMALEKKGKDLSEKAQRDQLTLTTEQKIDIQRQLQSIKADFELKKKFYEDDVNRTRQQEQAKLMQKIGDAINKVAQAEGYDLVVRAEATAFHIPTHNISEKVIAIISNPAG